LREKVTLGGGVGVGDGAGVVVGVALGVETGVVVPVDVTVLVIVAEPVAVGPGVPLGALEAVGVSDAVAVGRLVVGVDVSDCCGDRAVGEWADTAAGRALQPASASRRSSAPALEVKGRLISVSGRSP
jgi:hypothetical protein